jgi:hypothetical protein
MWLEGSGALAMLDFYSGKVQGTVKGQSKVWKARESYFEQLKQTGLFPCASFHQIKLDIPTLNFHEQQTESELVTVKQRSQAAEDLFTNYVKRASISQYFQSHGSIGARLVNFVFDTELKLADTGDFFSSQRNLRDPLIEISRKKAYFSFPSSFKQHVGKEDKEECIYWLYTCLRESKLPLSFYNNMIEAGILMSDIYDFLFEKLDPGAFQILQKMPGMVF